MDLLALDQHLDVAKLLSLRLGSIGPKLSHRARLLQVLDGLVPLAELPEGAVEERITRMVLRLDGGLICILEGLFLVFSFPILKRGLGVYSSSRSGW